jgi:epoxyqueuosine reductase
MHWMERTAAKRMDPGLVLEGARSAILLGVDYSRADAGGPAQVPRLGRNTASTGTTTIRLSPRWRRAGGVIEEIYGAGPSDYRYYVDTGPVLERAWAALSGVGFIGKNSMLISRRHGNWLFLASILTRLDLERTRRCGARRPRVGRPPLRQVHPLHGRLPHAGLPEPGGRGRAPLHLLPDDREQGRHPAGAAWAIGNRVYGCDTCLDVCPWNRFAKEGRRMILSSRGDIAAIPLRELLELTPAGLPRSSRGRR